MLFNDGDGDRLPRHPLNSPLCFCDILRGFGRPLPGSEDLRLLRWRKSIICRTRCFGKDISFTFAKEFYVFVPNVVSHYGRPSQFVLIRFNARRLDYSDSLLVPHNLESWISHPKESELHLTCFVVSLS